ncbi:unnamed protein product, partial [Urochloa humidicola]
TARSRRGICRAGPCRAGSRGCDRCRGGGWRLGPSPLYVVPLPPSSLCLRLHRGSARKSPGAPSISDPGAASADELTAPGGGRQGLNRRGPGHHRQPPEFPLCPAQGGSRSSAPPGGGSADRGRGARGGHARNASRSTPSHRRGFCNIRCAPRRSGIPERSVQAFDAKFLKSLLPVINESLAALVVSCSS